MALLTPPVYFDRDLSWLSFNERILQEAANPAVPLYERIRFLAIYSSNLDEFTRVRIPAIRALHGPEPTTEETADASVWPAVQQTIQSQLGRFGHILTHQLLPLLRQHQIHLYYQEALPVASHPFLSDYFYSRVAPFLQPVELTSTARQTLLIDDNALYLAVSLIDPSQPETEHYALVNIPGSHLPRFITLAPAGEQAGIAFLDDVIREHLPVIFPDSQIRGCYSFKLNRDADSTIRGEAPEAIEQQVARMIDLREQGMPSRFLFDAAMPATMRHFLTAYFSLGAPALIEGGRYHNLRDLEQLPNPAGAALTFPAFPPHAHAELTTDKSIFRQLTRRDYLLHLPYQSYGPVLHFFSQAAIDPHVVEIYVSLYRVASDSFIVNALMSAARNGKKVVVFVELKARFDEANNIKWGKRMKAVGITLIYSIPSLKVHAKTALVKRKTGLTAEYYGLVATGNFNERTARFYTDHVLLTSHPGITQDLNLLFAYLQSRQPPALYPFLSFKHLLVSQFNLLERFSALIDREIAHHRAGKPARITIKVNNLQEQSLIDKLYEASRAGVPVDLIVRSICCLVPGVPGLSETITVRRLVGRYLEHGRVFIFHNNGQPETYLGSADWMNRNIHHRIEVCCPVYDARLQTDMKTYLDIILADNQQVRLLDSELGMQPIINRQAPLVAQDALYAWLSSAANRSLQPPPHL